MLSPMWEERHPLFTDSSPPRSGFLTATLNELFKPLQIIFDFSGNQTESIARCFNEGFRIINKLNINASSVWTGSCKLHGTGSIHATFALPGNEVAGNLIRNAG